MTHPAITAEAVREDPLDTDADSLIEYDGIAAQIMVETFGPNINITIFPREGDQPPLTFRLTEYNQWSGYKWEVFDGPEG